MLKTIRKWRKRRKKRLKDEAKALCKTKDMNVVDIMYRDLSIVDGKAASLLTFNAIGLTALAVWLDDLPPNVFHLLLDGVFILFLISCWFLLPSVKIYWSYLFSDKNQYDSALVMLGKRRFRTNMSRIAWWITATAIVGLTLISLYHSYHTWKHATGRCESGCEHTEGVVGHAVTR